MIADLLGLQNDPNCTGVWIYQTQVSVDRVVFVLHVGFDGGANEGEWWRVTGSRLLGYQVTDPRQGYCHLADTSHPLVWQHTDAHRTLGFLGKPSNPRAVLADLWMCHAALTEGWFSRFLLAPIEQNVRLLAEGHGFLTSGPIRLMNAYADVLKRHNIESYFAGETNRQKTPEAEPVNGQIRAFIIGRNHLVGRIFTAQRLHRRLNNSFYERKR